MSVLIATPSMPPLPLRLTAHGNSPSAMSRLRLWMEVEPSGKPVILKVAPNVSFAHSLASTKYSSGYSPYEDGRPQIQTGRSSWAATASWPAPIAANGATTQITLSTISFLITPSGKRKRPRAISSALTSGWRSLDPSAILKRHSRTAPTSAPLTKCLCRNGYSTMSGAVVTTRYADLSDSGVMFSRSSTKSGSSPRRL